MTTVDPLTFTRDFVEGFAQLLAADTSLSWSDTANYAAGVTGIYIAEQPTGPDRCVTLMAYPLSEDPTLSNGVMGLQVRSRSARGAGVFDVMGLDDAVRNALVGRFPLTLPTGIRVSSLVWSSGASLGVDSSNRWMWSSNFTCGVGRPGAHRH